MQTGRLEQLVAFIDKQAAHFLNLLFSSTAFRSSFMFISRRWNEACNLDEFRPQGFVFRIHLVQFDGVKIYFCTTKFTWCWNLGTAGSRSETPGKFWNVVPEKDGKDQLDRSCEKWRSIKVKEQRNILREISKRKANWIGHILRWNCLLQRVIEGRMKGGI